MAAISSVLVVVVVVVVGGGAVVVPTFSLASNTLAGKRSSAFASLTLNETSIKFESSSETKTSI